MTAANQKWLSFSRRLSRDVNLPMLMRKKVPWKQNTQCQARVKNIPYFRPKWSKSIPFLRPKHLKNQTLRGRTYLYMVHIRQYPPDCSQPLYLCTRKKKRAKRAGLRGKRARQVSSFALASSSLAILSARSTIEYWNTRKYRGVNSVVPPSDFRNKLGQDCA